MKAHVLRNAMIGLQECKLGGDLPFTKLKYPEFGPYGAGQIQRCDDIKQVLVVSGEDYIFHIGNTACTAGLRSEIKEAGLVPLAIGSYTKRDVVAEVYLSSVDLSCRYLDWLIHRSPYAQCITTKSVHVALNLGIVFDTNHPDNLVVGGLIAHRRLWEYISVIESMLILVDAGVCENAAYYLAHVYNITSSKSVSPSSSSCHCSIDGGRATKESLLNFTNNTPTNPNDTYKNTKTYSKIHALWGATDMMGELRRLITGGVVAQVGSVPNPFSRTLILAEANTLALLPFVAYINKLLGEG